MGIRVPSASGTTGAPLDPAVEVAITGATTLDSGAFGKWHVCSGTTADYTIGLPAVAGNAGKFIGIRMAPGLTKFVTIDGSGAETIDGATTRIMWAQESAILLCDGVMWTKVAGRTRPMVASFRLNADQSIANAAAVKILLNAADLDNTGTMVDLANSRVTIRRPGDYDVDGQVYHASFTATRKIASVNKNGVQLLSTEVTSSSAAYGVPMATKKVALAASDQIELMGYQDSGTPRNVLGHATTNYTFLTASEIPTW